MPRKKKEPNSNKPKQTNLVNHNGLLRLEYQGKLVSKSSKKSQRKTSAASRTPNEIYLLIAQLDPLVAVRLNSVNRGLRQLIRAHIITLTRARFLPMIEGVRDDQWSIKPCLRGLAYYFGNKRPQTEARVNELIDHIDHRYLYPVEIHVRYWIRSLSEGCLTSAAARARTLLAIRTARAHYGGQYLALGNDDKGNRRFALRFLALAEYVVGTQFLACYHFSTRSFKITCNTRVYYEM